VPLAFEYSQTPLAERVAQALADGHAPVYLVHFTQRDAAEAAQALMSLDVCTREEKAAIAAELEGVKFNSPHGKDVKRWLRHGIGIHHAGLLPKYKILVERLAQQGRLKLICGTDTLGVGINVPIRTVLFTQLWKYDGKKAAVLAVRDFRQIAGRAGRKGFDDRGYVIAQAPEHVIENRRNEEKLKDNPQKLRKLVKARAPEGAVSWDAKTFERLQTAPPEGSVSRLAVSHGMMLLVLGRAGDGCRAMQRLIAECHEPPARKAALRKRAWQLFRALLERQIVEIIPRSERARDRGHEPERVDSPAPKLRVNVELQQDFSLHQALSLYLLDTLPRLDRESPDYPFDVLTLCEAIVEDPEQILRAQLSRRKTEKMAELKAAGVEYEERLAKLEELEHPKPCGSSCTRPSTRLRRCTRGSRPRTSGRNPSRGKCSSATCRSATTSGTTASSAWRACCCGISPKCGRCLRTPCRTARRPRRWPRWRRISANSSAAWMRAWSRSGSG
jgi:superfamily II RNA helicase